MLRKVIKVIAVVRQEFVELPMPLIKLHTVAKLFRVIVLYCGIRAQRMVR